MGGGGGDIDVCMYLSIYLYRYTDTHTLIHTQGTRECLRGVFSGVTQLHAAPEAERRRSRDRVGRSCTQHRRPKDGEDRAWEAEEKNDRDERILRPKDRAREGEEENYRDDRILLVTIYFCSITCI